MVNSISLPSWQFAHSDCFRMATTSESGSHASSNIDVICFSHECVPSFTSAWCESDDCDPFVEVTKLVAARPQLGSASSLLAIRSTLARRVCGQSGSAILLEAREK